MPSSSSDKVYTVDELRAIILPLLERHGMASASLFGSYARGEVDASSDIDVILVGRDGCRALDVLAVTEELHRASGKAVDVYEISELREGAFRDTVLREALAL